MPGRVQFHLPFRAALPPGDEGGRARARGAGCADDLQHSRTADESRRAAISPDWRIQPRGGRAHCADAGRHGGGTDLRRPWGGRLGRADSHGSLRSVRCTAWPRRRRSARSEGLSPCKVHAGRPGRRRRSAQCACAQGRADRRGSRTTPRLSVARYRARSRGGRRGPDRGRSGGSRCRGNRQRRCESSAGEGGRVFSHPCSARTRGGTPLSGASDFLLQMAASSRERTIAARRSVSEAALLDQALAHPQPPALLASSEEFDLIAELKLRSPAVGVLKTSDDQDIVQRVQAYAAAGAAAVSVLTEPSRFDGSLTHLQVAARALRPMRVPAMRKDFIVDPYQVIEARAAGAGGVLVILRLLPLEQIEALLARACELGLFVLLEAFDEQDIELMHETLTSPALESSTRGTKLTVLAGLNCRDLSTLQIVPARLLELAHLLPSSVPRVAESGVLSAEDAGRVAAAG